MSAGLRLGSRLLWALVAGGLAFALGVGLDLQPPTLVYGITGGAFVLGGLLGPLALELLG